MKQKRINKFSRNMSLGAALEEMEYNGMNEITRILPPQEGNNSWIFEYNVENETK